MENMNADSSLSLGNETIGKKGINRHFSEDDPKTPMTIVLHNSTRKQIKMYAIQHGTTVSSLIEQWIAEYCTQD